MRRFCIFAILLAALFCFASCTDGERESAITTGKVTDWRNTIEYEGSFFVNKERKMLYALDTGKITLWDNGGDGEPFQELSYDTSVPDAIERIEKDDFNGDGNCDIRILYSESEKGARYNLFLWDTLTQKFAECGLYNTITNPEFDEETGIVSGVLDMGIFGRLMKQYVFNSTSGLDLVGSFVENAEEVANKIAAETVGGTVRLAEHTVNVNGIECTLYIASEFGADTARIVCTPDAEWYVDEYCFGFYRLACDEDGRVVLGRYVGDEGTAQSIAIAIRGEDAEIMSKEQGYLNGTEAYRYTMRGEGGGRFAVVRDTGGMWYFAEDGDIFTHVKISTGEAVSDEEYLFELPDVLDGAVPEM